MTRSPDVTRLIDRLEARGLVRRAQDRTDRRAVRIRITAAGLERMEPLDAVASTRLKAVLGPLGRERLEQLRDLLGAVLDAVEPDR